MKNKYTALFVLAPVFLFISSCAGTVRTLPPGEMQTLSAWENNETVTTVYGRVSGKEKQGTFVWWSVPYAEPPVGDLRWKAPRPPEAWSGIYHAVRKPPESLQYGIFPKRSVKGQEDCLYLNVWRPAGWEKDLPVYLWIHGGGNSSGSSRYISDYYGFEFSRKTNAVFISVNYRLGPFGWFTHPALRRGDNVLDDSGNYGLLDIQQALNWVRDNITAFGGDPDNVTVAGESAGGFNILSLLTSPLSKDLFHKAIIRSGGIMQSSMQEGDDESSRVLRVLLEKDGYSEEEIDTLLSDWSDEQTASYLRSARGEDILRTFTPRTFGLIAFPFNFIDGTVIPVRGEVSFETGDYPMKVPVIIGSNRDEVKLFFSGRKDLRSREELYEAASRLGSDKWKVDGVDAIVRNMIRHEDQPPIFSYYFSWGSLDEEGDSVLPCNRGSILGACHALEVPFFHGTTRSTPFGIIFFSGKNREGAEKLEDAIMGYTEDFLRMDGEDPEVLRPLNAGYPEWQSWESEGLKYLILDAEYRDTSIRMSDRDFTHESIRRNLRNSFSDEIYREAVEYIDENGFSLKSMEKR